MKLIYKVLAFLIKQWLSDHPDDPSRYYVYELRVEIDTAVRDLEQEGR